MMPSDQMSTFLPEIKHIELLLKSNFPCHGQQTTLKSLSNKIPKNLTVVFFADNFWCHPIRSSHHRVAFLITLSLDLNIEH